MVSGLNLNNISVDDKGRISLSGISSGIDFNTAVDNIIAARRIPVDRLETKVETNSSKIAAFDELQVLMNTLRSSLDSLRGKVTFGGAGNIFQAKEVFASTSASGGSPSAAGNLLGVSVTNAAATGNHSLEVLQLAAAHKLSSDTATSKTENVGLALGGGNQSVHGAFEINGRKITVEPSDTLIDIADRINTANSGSSATGVSASVVSVSAGQHILVLTANETGESIDLATSQRIGGSTVASASTDLGTALGLGAGSVEGAFDINGVQVDLSDSDTLNSAVTKINAAGAGVTASVLTTDGVSRLALTSDDASQPIVIEKAHRIGGDTASATASDLGSALGLGANSVSGDFDVNGTLISVTTSDTLETLRDKINAADAGATAKIIGSGGSFTLAITSDDAGQQITLGSETSGVLADLGLSSDGGASFDNVLSDSNDVLAELGISNDGGASFVSVLSQSNDVLAALGISADGGATFINELQGAQVARFRADGLLDPAASQTAAVASADTAFGTTGTLSIELPDLTTHDIAIGAGDTPNTIKDAINAAPELQAIGVSAEVIEDDDGNFRVEIRQSALASADPGGVFALRHDDPAVDTLGIDDSLTFSFDSGEVAQIAVTAGQTLNDVRDSINGDSDLAAAGVSATIVTSGGKSRLVVQHNADLDAIGPAALDLSTPELILERSSNTVSDLFNGVTLTLFQAELGTTISLDVEQNLADVKDAILGFAESYNAAKSFINLQRLTDPESGGASEDAGPLFADPTLGTIEASLSRFLGQGAEGLNDGFRVLREIGIEFVDNDSVSDPLLADTLEIDETILDEKLLNDPAAVRKLFGFDFSSSSPQVGLLSYGGATAVSSDGYKLDVTMVDGKITGATINGVANSVTVSGTTLTATNATGANGLKLVYTGSNSAANIQLDFSKGVATNLFGEIERLLDDDSGVLDLEVRSLTEQNELTQLRIVDKLERLATQRDYMIARFVSMEEALYTMNNTLDTIRQQMDALSGGDN